MRPRLPSFLRDVRLVRHEGDLGEFAAGLLGLFGLAGAFFVGWKANDLLLHVGETYIQGDRNLGALLTAALYLMACGPYALASLLRARWFGAARIAGLLWFGLCLLAVWDTTEGRGGPSSPERQAARDYYAEVLGGAPDYFGRVMFITGGIWIVLHIALGLRAADRAERRAARAQRRLERYKTDPPMTLAERQAQREQGQAGER